MHPLTVDCNLQLLRYGGVVCMIKVQVQEL